mmetsp:Transcript_107678/g.304412  ORF Transcript_107678/g.304412 Transcript_107678/m.304412 type:complete len:181 (+) Transcript_107678:55-597(+)
MMPAPRVRCPSLIISIIILQAAGEVQCLGITGRNEAPFDRATQPTTYGGEFPFVKKPYFMCCDTSTLLGKFEQKAIEDLKLTQLVMLPDGTFGVPEGVSTSERAISALRWRYVGETLHFDFFPFPRPFSTCAAPLTYDVLTPADKKTFKRFDGVGHVLGPLLSFKFTLDLEGKCYKPPDD